MSISALFGTCSTPERITGQAITIWPARIRAHLAAQWISGRLEVSPTVEIAAEVFGISATIIENELAQIKAQPPEKISLTYEERQAVADVLGEAELWACLDIATQ